MEDKRLKSGGHFPNEFQTLLLKAALKDKFEALPCFLEWLELMGLNSLDLNSNSFMSDFMDKLDLGSQRLMPLVIENLGIDSHPYFSKFDGYRKNLWVRNQRIFLTAKELIKKLDNEGIPTILLKGLSLANFYYPRTETRPMNDGDILIPYKYRNHLLKCMKMQNNTYKMGHYENDMLEFVHASHFFRNEKDDIDIHWNIFTEYSHNPKSSIFAWQGALTYNWDGINTKTLNPTHEFFVAMAHGRHFGYIPPLRWVTDCVMILKKVNGKLDWEEFIRLCKIYKFKPFIKKALPYLQANFWTGIPDNVMKEMAEIVPTKDEVLYDKLITMDIRKYGGISLMFFGTKKFIVQHRLFLKDKPFLLYFFRWYKLRIKNELKRLIKL